MTADEAAEIKRLFGVAAEDLRGEIRSAAEGVATVTEDLAGIRVEVRQEFDRVHRDAAETRAMIQRSHGELERRIVDLESDRR